MQHIGIEYLKETGKEEELKSKNIIPD